MNKRERGGWGRAGLLNLTRGASLGDGAGGGEGGGVGGRG